MFDDEAGHNHIGAYTHGIGLRNNGYLHGRGENLGHCGRYIALGDELTVEFHDWKINVYIFGKKINTYGQKNLFDEFRTNNVVFYPAISIWGKGSSMQLVKFETEE